MPEGVIRWFNRKRGYGFIASEEGPDIFIHASEIQAIDDVRLSEGACVEYELVRGEKGPKAIKVMPKGLEGVGEPGA